ncbi:hypothetical protein [Nodularia spumigena]|jgi:hypothetical protein|uniref:hypothetical protein n=1 Tax=Nodularia spumigena TaxID=70799 RepID=UPI00232DD10A|nr:hypothetical protein [Nodularia spumigena]MDB9343552.1 hypothetical protein [Nodularia spumigena CS-588/06]MDB9369023.1 hypothetical protein [Nodularia spumigena CS-586/05]MEA5556402.1 hypothetical protein [Nodularia spumigena CH309]
MNYKLIVVVSCMSVFISGTTLGKVPDIKSNSCRLYNAYLLNGKIYSASDGIIINGEYPTATSEDECYSNCRGEQEYRTNNLPKIYTLQLECFYGKKSLYRDYIDHKHNVDSINLTPTPLRCGEGQKYFLSWTKN